jgi:hypothetical protein
LGHRFHNFKALEVGEGGVGTGSGSLLFVFHFPLSVDKSESVITDASGTHETVLRVMVFVEGVLDLVASRCRNIELTDAEAIIGLGNSEFRHVGHAGVSDVGTDDIGVLVETGSRELLRFVQSKLVHVQSLTHAVLSIIASTEAVLGLILSCSRVTADVVFVLKNFLYVKLLHVLTAHSKWVSLSFVLMVTHFMRGHLSQGARKVSFIVAITVRSPVPDVRFTYTKISETFGSGLETSGRGVLRILELGLMIVARSVVVVLSTWEPTGFTELVSVLAWGVINSWRSVLDTHDLGSSFNIRLYIYVN